MDIQKEDSLKLKLSNPDGVNLFLDRYFKYHPVQTNARQQKHNSVNEAARELARCVLEYGNGIRRDEFINQIQVIRMMLNQCITMDEIYELEKKAKEASD